MKAEIIPTGTEILLGNIVDTNSSFLANQLPLLGIDLYFISTVGDNRQRLVDTLRQAWTRADLIITTGGLGPTQGDITRETIAEFLGEELSVDAELWQKLQDFFKQRHREIPQSNIKQAVTIPSAQTIPNPIGTAPGWWVEKANHIIIAMPGPPDEMRLMWEGSILPKLRQRATGAVIISKIIKTFGLAEAKIDELLAPFSRLSNPTLASYIKPDGIHLRITAKAEKEAEAKHLVVEREGEIRNILAPYIWGEDEDTLESVIGTSLKNKKLTLATIESCSEGLLCNTIAGAIGSPAFFRGGLVACCNEVKVACGIDPRIMKQYGEESAEVAKAMAVVARKNFGSDIGMGIAGNMNLSGNSCDTFIGLRSDKFERLITQAFFGNRSRIKQRMISAALFELRKTLLEEA